MTATIGFLSVRRHADHGYFGGFLIVNRLARPLEFHCTLPVKPSRAQAVLYGPTIDDFVCGEQIAKALITKAKLKPELLICDSSACLALTHVSDVLALKLDLPQGVPVGGERLELPPETHSKLAPLATTDNHFSVLRESAVKPEHVESILDQLPEQFDFVEPFQRIIEALLEAHPIARAA